MLVPGRTISWLVLTWDSENSLYRSSAEARLIGPTGGTAGRGGLHCCLDGQQHDIHQRSLESLATGFWDGVEFSRSCLPGEINPHFA